MPLHNPDLARHAKELLNGIAGELSALVTAGKPYSLDRATRAFGGLKGRVTAAVDCLTLLQLAPLASDLGVIYCAADDELERIVRVHYDKQKPGSARLGEKRFVLPLARTDVLGVHYNEDERFLFPRAPTDDAEYQELQERLWRVFIDAAIEAQRVAAKLADFLADRLNDGNGGGQGGEAAARRGVVERLREQVIVKVIVRVISAGVLAWISGLWSFVKKHFGW